MLVLNKSVHHEEGWQPITKYKERVGENVSNLLEAIAEINLYLPDDWRMTRSRNNFRILVTPRTGKSYLIVGSSYRANKDSILHIIDSIFEPHYFDQYDLNAVFNVKLKVIDEKIRRKYDDMLKPNLYYFEQCPDDSESPLFARQYEKEMLDHDGMSCNIHFHRIHPLHRWGIELDHHKWIRWEIGGKVDIVDYPENGYHGKDYWKIPKLEGSGRGSAQSYADSQKKIFKEYNIDNFEFPEQPSSPYEQEYKFIINKPLREARKIRQPIKDFLQKEGYALKESGSGEQTDIYFDDEQYHLFKRGVSFRFRKRKESARITLKMRPAHLIDNDQPGEYQRIEEEVSISKSHAEALLEGKKINSFPFRMIPYVIPECGKLKPVVTVSTKREQWEIVNSAHQKAELCFDTVTFEHNGKISEPEFEIEIESKGLPREEIATIAAVLQTDLGLMPSAESKYERAVQFLQRS